jgi:archaeal preflagellin peptidase FlaK
MEVYRIVFALTILVYACCSDIKKRSVSNIVWLIILGMGIAYAGYSVVVQGIAVIIPLLISLAISVVMSFIFFRLGFFGAADAKAIICIAFLFPSLPKFSVYAYHFPLFDLYRPLVFPFALIVLLNAGVLALTVPVSLFFRNLHNSGLKKLLGNFAICFVASRANINNLENVRFARLLYDFDEIGGGRLKRRYSFGGSPLNKPAIERLKAYQRDGKIAEEVWITPEVPFILFITLGFILACFTGV